MSLDMNEQTKKAVEILGGTIAAASKLGVKPPAVSDWLAKKRPIPIKRCVQIEELTQGAVTRRDLRPDDWAEIWPELAQPESKEI